MDGLERIHNITIQCSVYCCVETNCWGRFCRDFYLKGSSKSEKFNLLHGGRLISSLGDVHVAKIINIGIFKLTLRRLLYMEEVKALLFYINRLNVPSVY